MSNLMNLLKAKHHPEQFKAEQEEADKLHAERLEAIQVFKDRAKSLGVEHLIYKKQ